jgi:pimeloyl-ACP methyl ester carboxylesterase
MRALEPAQSGQLKLAGFQIGYEVFGDPSAPAVLLLPTWQIIHSRMWKMQIPWLARCFRVITYDPPGNGRGERTTDPAAYEFDRIVDQGIGLLDHLGVAQADVVGVSRGCVFGLWMAARYPERVGRLVLLSGSVTPERPGAPITGFWERREPYAGWEKYNGHYWLAHYEDWLRFFFGELFSEPHSFKGIEDCLAWAQQTTPEVLVQTTANPALLPRLPAPEAIRRVRCPVLLVQGDDDRDVLAPYSATRSLAEARPDWEFVTVAGGGHVLMAREPVRVNLLIAEFLHRQPQSC